MSLDPRNVNTIVDIATHFKLQYHSIILRKLSSYGEENEGEKKRKKERR
jgi:hypothetical protein